jgi:hypothetical protein
MSAGLRSTVPTRHWSDYFYFLQPTVLIGTFPSTTLCGSGIETLREHHHREHQACVNGNENADAN